MRSGIVQLAVLHSLIGSLAACHRTLDLEAEKAALLKTVDAEIGDLLAADTAALRAELAQGDTVYNVAGGQIYRVNHANALEGYDFATVRYTAATILDSRVVHLSPDGRMAWIVTRYRFTYTRKNGAAAPQQGELIDAALTVYEKKGSRWVGAALAQTFPSPTK